MDHLTEFYKQIETLPSVEEKIRESINYMRGALSQDGAPNLKGFWEVRRRCLPFFKENLPHGARGQFWETYIELTREGRELKSRLDEESSFAAEQIGLAIQALEKEIDSFSDQSYLEADLPDPPRALKENHPSYLKLQGELNTLNRYASRIHDLRKELIATEMRIRKKNHYFQRLSKLGDFVFPKRKKKIEELSHTFMGDINHFFERNFSEKNFDRERIRRSVFGFRQEIRTLQAIAKDLTINTEAFSSTRVLLSECWNSLKGMEKELKQESTQLKQASAEYFQKIQQQIDALKEQDLPASELQKVLDRITKQMRNAELTREDLSKLKQGISQVQKNCERGLENEQKAFERARQDKIDCFENQLESLETELDSSSIEQLSTRFETLQTEIKTLSLSKLKKQTFQHRIKVIQDSISHKQEEMISEDDRASIDRLEEILGGRRVKRKEVKDHIEELRRTLGGSSLDFERGIELNELMASEKERLEKLDVSISELELKIKTLKAQ